MDGRLIPRGRGLVAAITAGWLWSAALALGTRLPGQMRFAHLYLLRTHEGVGWAQVFISLLAVGGLLGIAYRLSAIAHGSGRSAPTPVRVVRAITVTAFVLVCVAAVSMDAALGEGCFRSCEPFPR